VIWTDEIGTDRHDDWARENGVRVPPNVRYGTKMGHVPVKFERSLTERLLARWRIWWNLCPVCNSDAPECDRCWLCGGSREFPLSTETRARYKKAYDLT
jgi:hypothetical protein